MMTQHREGEEGLLARNGRLLVYSLVSFETTMESMSRPIGFPSTGELLFIELEEWLPDESASNVVNRGNKLGTSHFLLDLIKSCLDTLTVCTISADSNGLATCIVDLFHNGLIVGWFTSK